LALVAVAAVQGSVEFCLGGGRGLFMSITARLTAIAVSLFVAAPWIRVVCRRS